VWIEPQAKKANDEEEEDMIFIEEYYKLMANLLV